jgi:hypothetical protein
VTLILSVDPPVSRKRHSKLARYSLPDHAASRSCLAPILKRLGASFVCGSSNGRLPKPTPLHLLVLRLDLAKLTLHVRSPFGRMVLTGVGVPKARPTLITLGGMASALQVARSSASPVLLRFVEATRCQAAEAGLVICLVKLCVAAKPCAAIRPLGLIDHAIK